MKIIRGTTVLVCDDPILAAAISSAFSEVGFYFVVLEGPRMMRPDALNEVVRIINVINRFKPETIIFAKQPKEGSDAILKYIKADPVYIESLEDFQGIPIDVASWSGIKPEDAALKLYQSIVPDGTKSLAVAYDKTDEVLSVIAANYAIAHDADLFIIDTPKDLDKKVVEQLNKISAIDPSVREYDIRALSQELKTYLPKELLHNGYSKIMFINKGIPYGIALPDDNVVYAHSINTGQQIAHNMFDYEWGQIEKFGGIGLFVANTTMNTDEESKAFSAALLRAKGITKEKKARDTKLTEWEIMCLPYDVLYIATHGQQIIGSRNTYRFKASDDAEHTIIVKEGIGAGSAVVFIESVDGNVKDAPEWTKDHGKIWAEFMKERFKLDTKLSPETSEQVELEMRELVLGNEPGMSSPMGMDNLASSQRPLVIVSACGSWTDLVTRFIYAGASSYIGTLWPIKDSVAVSFGKKFLGDLFNIEVMPAFNNAKQSLTDEMDRWAYAMSGTFESKFDPGASYKNNGIEELKNRLSRNIKLTKVRLKENEAPDTPEDIKRNTITLDYFYEQELKTIIKESESV